MAIGGPVIGSETNKAKPKSLAAQAAKGSTGMRRRQNKRAKQAVATAAIGGAVIGTKLGPTAGATGGAVIGS